MDTTPAPVPPVTLETEDKTVAIVGYLTIIGFIVAVVLHGNKKTALGTFHLRQTLGLFITAVACWILNWVLAFIPIVGWLTIPILWLGVLALWLIGFIGAAGGKMTPVPVLGAYFQKWFHNTF